MSRRDDPRRGGSHARGALPRISAALAAMCIGLSVAAMAVRAQKPAAAQPSPAESAPDAAARLEALERRVAAATGAERSALAGECDQVRGVLAEMAPDDVRAPTWLIDRAVYAIDRLADDGADNSVLLGLPTWEQRRRCVGTAVEALHTLGRAQSLAETSTARLEESILDLRGAQGDVAERAADAERALHRLVDLEQAQRIPYLTAAWRVILAAAGEGDQAAAQAAAGAIQEIRLRTPAMEAARDVLVVCAVVSTAPALRDRARGVLASKLRAVLGGAAADGATRARARLALLVLGENDGAAESRGAWGERLALAEAKARRRLSELSSTTPRRWETAAAHLGPVLALAREPAPSAEKAGARRALVYGKVGAAIDPKAPAVGIDGEVNLARAVALLHETEFASPVAEAFLQSVIDAPDTPAELRGDALWELGVAIQRRKGYGDAVARQVGAFGRMLREMPDHPRAVAAAEFLAKAVEPDWACLAAAAAGREPGTLCAPVGWEFTAAINLLMRAEPSDAWRLATIRAELWRDPRGVDRRSFDVALDTFGLFSGPSAERERAESEITASLPRALRTAAGGAPVLGPEDRVRIARRAEAWAAARGLANAGALRLALGETLRSAPGHEDEAATVLRSLIGSAADAPGSPAGAHLRLELAAAERARGRASEAFTVLRDLAQQYERGPGERGRAEPYWAAWAEMLGLLADSGDAAKRQEILGTIKRLEIIDPALGGGLYAERIRRAGDTAAR